MSQSNTLFIGLDVHKDTTDASYVSDNLTDTVQYYGTIPTTTTAINKLLVKLAKNAKKIVVIYEAGPCGFWLYRHLTKKGITCWVVAPSMTPKAPGDKVKNDKRDSATLARLARTNDIRPIYVPDDQDEAMRDLVRCREDAMLDLRQARQRLKSFLLRHGHPCNGRQNWTESYRRYLADIHFTEPARKLAYQECINMVNERQDRLDRIEVAMQVHAEAWRWFPLVQRLMVLRGIRFLTALVLVAELGDLRRFTHPASLMKFVGLTPSEYTTGPRQRYGSITKCGNTHARRVLIESAWSYRFAPKVGREHEARQQQHSPKLIQRSWQVQLRLCNRFRRLRARGKEKNKVVVAIARELLGFVWDIAQGFDPLTQAEPVR